MPTLGAILKSEIRRHVARNLKKALRPLRRVQKQLKALKALSRGQHRALTSLDRKLTRLKLTTRSLVRTAGRIRRGAKGPRVSAPGIRSLRARFKMTRVQFAKLVGVSPGSIFGWENARTTPRGKSMTRLLELKKTRAPDARAPVAKPRRRKRPQRRRPGRRRRR